MMATNQEDESPPPYSCATVERLDGIDSYIPEQMLATQELNDLFLPRNVMVAFSIGLFLSAFFMILAGHVTTMTLRWNLLASTCFTIGGGIMSGPFWMLWQKNEVKQAHSQRFMAQNDPSYLEKAPEKIPQVSYPSDTDPQQKWQRDAATIEKVVTASQYSTRDNFIVWLHILLMFVGDLIAVLGFMTIVSGWPTSLAEFIKSPKALHRSFAGFCVSLVLVLLGVTLMAGPAFALFPWLSKKNRAKIVLLTIVKFDRLSKKGNADQLAKASEKDMSKCCHCGRRV